MEFIHDPCKGCGGSGCSNYPPLRPHVCEICNGSGEHANPLATAALIVVIGVTTFAPIIWIWARNG